MQRQVTYTRAREQFADLLERVTGDREVVIVTRRNREDVAMIAASELASLQETAHLLRSPENARRLLEAMAASRRGEGERTTVDALRAEFNLGEEEQPTAGVTKRPKSRARGTS